MRTPLLALAFMFFPAPPAGLQGDGLAIVQFTDPTKVHAACARWNGGWAGEPLQACSKAGAMILPNPCRWPLRESYAEIVCHELGHAAHGWKH